MVGEDRTAHRRWRFAGAEFDEGSWTLHVAGRRVPLENKPLRLLQTLLDQPGLAVSKDALLDAVWPGVIVVEGSLTTAMNKLRRALDDGDGRIIETVPGIGYRLAVQPELVTAPAAPAKPTTRAPASRLPPWAIMAGAAALMAIAAIVLIGPHDPRPQPVNRLDVLAAMRMLDLPALRHQIAQGWDPRQAMGRERNSSIGTLLEICEWDRDHDKRRLMLGVVLLMDAGASPSQRNVWGDTAYSIASSPRYCGPDHPATQLLKRACTGSKPAIDPDCLADYANSDWPQVTPPLPQAG